MTTPHRGQSSPADFGPGMNFYQRKKRPIWEMSRARKTIPVVAPMGRAVHHQRMQPRIGNTSQAAAGGGSRALKAAMSKSLGKAFIL